MFGMFSTQWAATRPRRMTVQSALVDVDVRKKVTSAARQRQAELVHDARLGRLVDGRVSVDVAGAVAHEVVKVHDGVDRRILVEFDADDLLLVVAVLVGEDLPARHTLDGDDHCAFLRLVVSRVCLTGEYARWLYMLFVQICFSRTKWQKVCARESI